MDRGYPCGSLLPDFVITLNVRAFLLFLETCNGGGNDFGIKVMYQNQKRSAPRSYPLPIMTWYLLVKQIEIRGLD